MPLLPTILDRLRPTWSHLLDEPEKVRLQICFTPLVREGKTVSAPTETFRADAEYFYPASTVKLLAAICVLRRVRALQRQGGAWSRINLDTPLTYYPENAEPINHDETNREGGALTLRHSIRRALIVSENPPHNRLYEFLGHEEFNRGLDALGFSACVMNHRLDDVRPPDEQRTTPRIVATLASGEQVEIPKRVGPVRKCPPGVARTRVGVGHFKDGQPVPTPMDFAVPGAEKNRVRLTDLHELGVLMAPRPSDAEHSLAAEKLAIDAEDLTFLHRCMTMTPRESQNPTYDAQAYPDDYVKPVLPGVQCIEPGVAVTNKLGWAYGFVTDTAVLHTMRPGVHSHGHGSCAMALTFTLWACPKGVLGNDDYDYNGTAKPFAAALAREAWHVWAGKA